MKHLAKLFLWVQDHVTRREIKFKKFHTLVNVSDIQNSIISFSTVLYMMELMSYRFVTGRAGLALTACAWLGTQKWCLTAWEGLESVLLDTLETFE